MSTLLRSSFLLTVFFTLFFATLIHNTNAAPAPPSLAEALGNSFKKRLMLPNVPLASDINGAHILLKNDLDSMAPKYSFLLLSHPRDYYAGMAACASMGDGESQKLKSIAFPSLAHIPLSPSACSCLLFFYID